jgi:hypothetical protein
MLAADEQYAAMLDATSAAAALTPLDRLHTNPERSAA